jgi:hypothetical protein
VDGGYENEMMEDHANTGASTEIDHSTLRADCERCFGLCCVALPFADSVDFAIHKNAGQPCPNLRSDFRCGVHTRLRPLGFRGCTVYDCYGAGQKVRKSPSGARLAASSRDSEAYVGSVPDYAPAS